MSTLCEPVAQEEIEQQANDAVWNFKYPLIAPVGFPSARAASQAEREIRIQRAETAAIEAARQNGFRQGEAQAEAAMTQRLEQERRAISEAVEQFVQERRDYFRRVETDVVTLALAIARKLLHREAQIDPLLLSGIVRVALDQVQAGSQVVLRCSSSEQGSWQKFLSSLPESNREITLTADDAVEPGRVILETVAGKAEIGLEEQLKEIESGFLDLLRADEKPSS
jgi:flagellar assembly protein FliH